VLDVLAQSTDLMAKTGIAKKTGMSRYLVDKIIEELIKEGEVFRKGERYGIHKRRTRDE
jgi:predicted transcriptional regulator